MVFGLEFVRSILISILRKIASKNGKKLENSMQKHYAA